MSKKSKKSRTIAPIKIRGTYHLTEAGVEAGEVRSLILRRRLQLLVHSYIYYDLNQNLVSDDTWSSWARELVELQEKYPNIARRVDYHEGFIGFDGSTGFDLPYRQPEIMNKANWLVNNYKEVNNGKLRHKANQSKLGSTIVRLLLP